MTRSARMARAGSSEYHARVRIVMRAVVAALVLALAALPAASGRDAHAHDWYFALDDEQPEALVEARRSLGATASAGDAPEAAPRAAPAQGGGAPLPTPPARPAPRTSFPPPAPPATGPPAA